MHRCQSSGARAEPQQLSTDSYPGHHLWPSLSEGCFCPKKPMAEVNPRRHQALYSPVLIPGPSASSQHPPIHSPSASEATKSKEVSKCGTILHSSGLFCLGCFVLFSSILSLSLLLFPCLRAGKTTPACLQERNVSPDTVSSTRKTLRCFLAAPGRAVDDSHVSSHKHLKGEGCNPGQGQRLYRPGHVVCGHGLHPGPLVEEHGWPAESGEELAEA